MIEDTVRYQAQIVEPHSLLSAVTDHLLFDELEAFGAWDIIKAATDVVFEAWNDLTLGIPDEALCQPVCAWRVTEAEFTAAFSRE